MNIEKTRAWYERNGWRIIDRAITDEAAKGCREVEIMELAEVPKWVDPFTLGALLTENGGSWTFQASENGLLAVSKYR